MESMLDSKLKIEKNLYCHHDYAMLRKNTGNGLSGIWREKVVSWMYNVIDLLRLDRSIVYDAMSLMDRYLVKASGGLINEKVIQHTSIAAIYNAICHERNINISLQSIMQLRNGEVCIEKVRKISSHMRRILTCKSKTRCTAASPSSFVILMVSTDIPSLYKCHDMKETVETAVFLCELSICDFSFTRYKPSQIAYAAIQVARILVGLPKSNSRLPANDSLFLQQKTGHPLILQCTSDVLISGLIQIYFNSTESRKHAINL